jgi:cation transport ATPase
MAEGKEKRVSFVVRGMTCARCAAKVEAALAAAAMSLSSLCVVLNSLRLSR